MIVIFLLGAAAVLLLHGYVYSRNWFRSLSVRVMFSQPHVCAHDTLELTEVIENRKRMAVPVVEIGFRVPRGLHFEDADNTLESDFIYKRDIFAVSGMERIVRRYRITAQRRGFYSVSQLTCHAPSRLFHRIYMMDRMAQDEDAGLYVYAANVNCSLLLRAVEVILGENESARRVYEDPFVFSSIRPYTIQDPMKSVNWKATAKAGELMVNPCASTSAVRVRIFLDVSADPLVPFSDSFREYGISMAASLIRSLVKKQLDASLIVNAPAAGSAQDEPGVTRFLSCFGAAKVTAVEEYLASDFDSKKISSFEDMIRHETAADTRSVYDSEMFVFITSQDTPSLRLAVLDLLGAAGSGILALLSRSADRRIQERVGGLYVLPVCDD